MNKKSLVKIINQELTIIVDFVEGFDKSGNVHPKEIDLVLSKVRDIYDELLLLKDDDEVISLPDSLPTKQNKITKKKKLDAQTSQEDIKSNEIVEPDVEETIKEVITVIEEPDITIDESEVELNTSEQITKDDSDEQKEEIVQHITIDSEKVIEETKEPIADKKLDSKIKVEEPQESSKEEESLKKKKTKGEGKIIADKFSKSSPSVNDMLTSVKNNKNLASILKDSPIIDLKKVEDEIKTSYYGTAKIKEPAY